MSFKHAKRFHLAGKARKPHFHCGIFVSKILDMKPIILIYKDISAYFKTGFDANLICELSVITGLLALPKTA